MLVEQRTPSSARKHQSSGQAFSHNEDTWTRAALRMKREISPQPNPHKHESIVGGRSPQDARAYYDLALNYEQEGGELRNVNPKLKSVVDATERSNDCARGFRNALTSAAS